MRKSNVADRVRMCAKNAGLRHGRRMNECHGLGCGEGVSDKMVGTHDWKYDYSWQCALSVALKSI